MNKSILFVANVCKEHILKFHVPTIYELKQQGWNVDVAASGEDSIPYCDHQYHTSWKRSPFTFKLFTGIKELKEIIEKNHYDVIYCHTPVGGLVARIAGYKARRKGTKIVYFAHGFHFFKGAPLKNWLIFYPIEKILAKCTDYLIVINQEDFDFARKKKLYQKDIFKIPGIGINLKRFEQPENVNWRQQIRDEFNIKNEFVLIYVAEIIENKNQKALIDVMNMLLKENKDVKLLLVGPEHDHGKTKKYVEKLHLESNVIFTGWREDIGALLYASDLYLASSYREGYGINLVEAMACGLPVVAFENRGHRETIQNGKNGFMVKMNDLEAMCNKIKEFMSMKHDAMTEYAIEYARKLDVKKIAAEIVKLLNRVAN